MPEISEVRPPREGIDEIATEEGQGVQEGKDPNPIEQPGTLTAAQAHRYRDLKDNVSFMAIVSLVFTYDIPLVDLPARQGVEGRSYGLGAGVSSTVKRHEAGAETTDYFKLICAPEEIASSAKRLHRLIWQELQVFCHPFLKCHENICRLMFVGWEDTSLLPVLALEHATYGTLAKALQHLRSYGSDLRKSHLTLDIVAGLAALHTCGLVHGDIKTSNIIIQEHPSRLVVAKLSDFNGVGPVSTFGRESHYSFGSPIWQPPEVLFEDEVVDWQNADVYSLGMVIATIWASRGYIPEGGTFLDPELPYDLNPEARNMLIGKWKLESDDNARSLINMAKQRVEAVELIPVHSLLSRTLSSLPENRHQVLVLVQDLWPFMNHAGRQLNLPERDTPAPDTYNDDVSYRYGVVGNPKYGERSRTFKGLCLKTMLEIATSTLNSITVPRLSDLPDPFEGDDTDLVHCLKESDRSHQLRLTAANIPTHFQMLASQIYLSYFIGCGTKVDEFLGATWFHHAANAGDGRAIQWFCSVEKSLENPLYLEAPRRLWAASAALSGFERSSGYLLDFDPDLSVLATMAYRRRWWGRSDPQIVQVEDYFQNLASTIRADLGQANNPLSGLRSEEGVQEKPLHFCAATGKLDFAKFLVTEAGAELEATNARNETPIFHATRAGQFEMSRFLFDQGSAVTHISTEGVSIMHCLSLMDDDYAATLMPLYLGRGADISLKASETPDDYADEFSRGSGLPILWAAMKKRYRLFDAFLDAHKEDKLSFEDVGELLEATARFHLYEMLAKLLGAVREVTTPLSDVLEGSDLNDLQSRLANLSIQTDPTVSTTSTFEIADLILGQEFLSSLLELALEYPDAIRLQRRYLHGSKFRVAKKSTIMILLEWGADPLETGGADITQPGSNALSTVVYEGDATVLSLFVDHLEYHEADTLAVLASHDIFGDCNALMRSIYVDGYDSFLYLLDRYPALMDIGSDEGRSSLHAAATKGSPAYARQLLEHGADRYVRARDGATPFIWAVMRSTNLEVATVLAEGADMEEVLGPDPDSGFTAFAKVLSGMTMWKMDIEISRLRYLVDKFGLPSFYSNVPDQCTLFRTLLLLRTPFTDREQLDIEANTFRYVVQLFPAKVDYIDNTGMAPLHYAAAYANVYATRILLQHGADANILTSNSEYEESSTPGGHTPLDVAIMVMRRGPDSHLREGSVDIEIWQRMVTEVIQLLHTHGGESGPSASTSTLLRAAATTNPQFGEVVSVMDADNTPDIADRTGDAEWPRRLPWEMEREPFAVQGFSLEENAPAEVIQEDGLSVRMPAGSLRLIQILVGAIDRGVRDGNMAPRLPTPPEGYVDSLRRDWLLLKQEWKSVLQRNIALETSETILEEE
ncbi:Fc.00g025850.m01.CDS01 [Cosmosporella sp. VM-42]